MMLFAQTGVFIHKAFGFLIGIGYRYTEHFKNLCDGALSGADPAGETDAQNGRHDYFLSAAAVTALLAFWLHSIEMALFSIFR